VVSSHSACNALNQHIRAKSDEVIKAIADSGGYNGICCLPAFLGGKGDINALLDHIDYMVKKFGADHVAIGTDCGASSSDCVSEYSKYEAVARKRRPGWESFWPGKTDTDGNKFSKKHTDSLSWMNWPLFTVGLVQRGHSDDDIRKIIGGNVMRVIRAQSS
jgi:membrane dipeptidase